MCSLSFPPWIPLDYYHFTCCDGDGEGKKRTEEGRQLRGIEGRQEQLIWAARGNNASSTARKISRDQVSMYGTKNTDNSRGVRQLICQWTLPLFPLALIHIHN